MKLFTLAFLLFLVGCASPNPNFNPAQPPSATNPAYVPNKTVTGIVDVGNQVAPVVPPPYNGVLIGGLALATAIASIFAGKANSAKNSAQATANQLAASVAAQPPSVSQAILDHASNNEAVYPAVAGLVNSKTV